ncbi:MAG TPA: hypothetical protein VFQ38_21150 [Longimicrobiales bacterium]|nr:hypothetical protein [Longimicrobiales bacterium]
MSTASFPRWIWLAAALAAPAAVFAQEPAAPRPAVGPPVQRIATASALSTERLGSILGVRELPDGRVLVNDGGRRRLLLMDTALSVVAIVLDSLSDVANAYGTQPGALIPFRGDTTLFVDPASYAVVVLDPQARIARIRSVWRVEDVPWLMTMGGAGPGVDARGRVVYRIPAQPQRPRVAPPPGVPYIPQPPDSAFVVAVDLETRRADTLGSIRIPRNAVNVRRTVEGRFTFEPVIDPLPRTDEWAVLPDGVVAFVRGRDYRIEYLNPDGTLTSSAKLPFEWTRLTDEDKARLADSVKVAQQRMATMGYVTMMIRWVNQYGRAYPRGFTVPEGYVLPPGFPKDWILPPGVRFPPAYIYACAPGQQPISFPASSGPVPFAVPSFQGGPTPCLPAPVTIGGGVVPPPPTMRTVSVLPASELPDYKPPIPPGSVRADQDGNLWIRTLPPRPVPGGVVFDIVDRSGVLVSRLQIPPGYTVAGFGRGKVVYLTTRDAAGIRLARVRLK